uniref:Uncharacterized protein n=1 Tax=Prolemur simus TaxID=1328070 RepID=A0A8C9DDA3_PROSS
MSHEAYLLHAGLAPFLLNAVGWLRPSPGAPVGVHPFMVPLLNILQDSGIEAQVEPEPGEPLGVYCTSANNDTMTVKLIQFVKRGGGLLIGGHTLPWPLSPKRWPSWKFFPSKRAREMMWLLRDIGVDPVCFDFFLALIQGRSKLSHINCPKGSSSSAN